MNEASVADVQTKERREEFYRKERKAAEPKSKNRKIPLLHLPRRGGEKRGLSASGIGFLVLDFDFWISDLSGSFVSDFELRISDFNSVVQ